jgi:predicted nucleic-acid-binding protein
METDSMFLLDTNPLLKILIFEEQKDTWVNEFFEGRQKKGRNSEGFFSAVVGKTMQVL